jgi:hypothetical protein
MSFDRWCPRHKAETQAVVDHGEPSRGQIQPLPIHTRNGIAFVDWATRQPSVRRDPRLGSQQLAALKRIEKVAGEHHPLGLALGKTFADEMPREFMASRTSWPKPVAPSPAGSRPTS